MFAMYHCLFYHTANNVKSISVHLFYNPYIIFLCVFIYRICKKSSRFLSASLYFIESHGDDTTSCRLVSCFNSMLQKFLKFFLELIQAFYSSSSETGGFDIYIYNLVCQCIFSFTEAIIQRWPVHFGSFVWETTISLIAWYDLFAI